jgi:hypothetical protein
LQGCEDRTREKVMWSVAYTVTLKCMSCEKMGLDIRGYAGFGAVVMQTSVRNFIYADLLYTATVHHSL